MFTVSEAVALSALERKFPAELHWLGYSVFSRFSAEVIAATTAVAAGAILVILTELFSYQIF